MIEATPFTTRYLSRADIVALHGILTAVFENDGAERMPPFRIVDEAALDALLMTPKQSIYGREIYPSLPEKAAIIYYTVNKRHLFVNGNKRMSVVCVLHFLFQNGYKLAVTAEELTEVTLQIARSDPHDFPRIKQELVAWISGSLLPLEPDPRHPSRQP